MRSLGQFCLLAAFVGTGYSACASIAGWHSGRRLLRRSGLAAGLASGLALSVAMAALVYGLLLKDFRFAYVAQYSSRLLPWHYSVSSLWVGQAGSLLLWSWMSTALAIVFRCGPRRQPQPCSLREPAFGVLMAFCCFLVATMIFAADPLAPSLMPAADGAGLSPILQHPSMLIHPPIVFLGYAAWSIPFALAITALATGRLDATWAREARSWALLAWTVLGAGILIGAHWAYDELGWGGYWGWDPVENGSLIPWLLGTSAIHTTMAWRYRGMLKKTALGLTVATFAMCNFATFLTRSGIFSSLHAFSRSPIGWLFLGLLLLVALPTVYWTIVRRRNLVPELAVPTLWCREALVIVSTLALVALTLVICAGTVSTAIFDATIGRKIVVGSAFYNNALIPTGLLILLATAAAPLLRWGGPPARAQWRLLGIAATAGSAGMLACWLLDFRHPLQAAVGGLACFAAAALAGAMWLDARGLSNNIVAGLLRTLQTRRQQYSGFVIHLGLFCLAVGVAASSLSAQRHEAVMHAGQTIDWQGRRVRLTRITQTQQPDKLILAAHLEIHDRSGRLIHVTPAQHFHFRQNEWTTEVGNHSDWRGDLYTILHHAETANGVRLSLVDNPMMRWIWLGGWVMGLGALTAVWPKFELRLSKSETNRKSEIQTRKTTRAA
jgi:cytochrome c-type biogenesis protein CcmF